MDIYITCQNCLNEFIFTEDDILFYKQKGWGPPKRCPVCRKSKYLGIKEITKSTGLKQSNIQDNPKNHAGIAPIGIPHSENKVKDLPTQIIQLYCEEGIYYLRIVPLQSKRFSFVYLTGPALASQFEKDADFDYILECAKQFHQFTDFRILYYPPSNFNTIYTGALRGMVFNSESIDYLYARKKYIEEFPNESVRSGSELSQWLK